MCHSYDVIWPGVVLHNVGGEKVSSYAIQFNEACPFFDLRCTSLLNLSNSTSENKSSNHNEVFCRKKNETNRR